MNTFKDTRHGTVVIDRGRLNWTAVALLAIWASSHVAAIGRRHSRGELDVEDIVGAFHEISARLEAGPDTNE